MGEKRMVSKNVAIALGIICIVLIAVSVVEIAYYTSIVDDKVNTIYSLNTQISQLNSNITSLQNMVGNMTDILNLQESTVWVSGETIDLMKTIPYQENASYAGYIVAQVSSSQSNETVVITRYSSNGLNYDNRVNVGSGGTAIFPVLPSSNIQIIFGNLNPQDIDISRYATIALTYYY